MQAQRLAVPAVAAGDRPARAPRARLRSLAIMAVTAIAIVAVALVVNRPAAGSGGLTPVDIVGTPNGPPPIVDQAAPPFTATALDGSSVTLAQFAGSPIWVTFGASWCQPCRAENPDIQAAYAAHREAGLVVIQIYMNEDGTAVAEYAERVGLTYVKVADPDARLSTDYRILGIPTHFFIDRAGVLRQTKVGTLDRAGMDAILADLMS